ncbi:hypothetical protein OVY48_22480 [Sphingobium sp. SA2]|uniref:hypothetical protein n=1 Tax=Sphingobium sp. SA2 TaxID=1524832 RepID=UPI0028C1A680|nr:hypothetical protein [Sphingobium sp. SA2]MDT7536166.1 hypothetical protein [Sphingobium sp. SA2]
MTDQAGFTLSGALMVRSGEALALPLILQNGAGESQDLLGRSFVLSFRLSRASEPFLSVAGVLADDHFSVSFLVSSANAAAIYEAGRSRALRGDITEVGGTFRHSFPVTVDEGSGVPVDEPISLPNFPVTELVAMPGATIVIQRGAQGYGAERRLYDAGLIYEPTVAAMDARYALVGASGAEIIEFDEARTDYPVGKIGKSLAKVFQQGASAIPIIGRELLGYDPDTYTPEGVQSVIGVGFKSSNPAFRTRAAMLAQVAAEIGGSPSVLVDDGPALVAAVLKATKLGYPLIISEPIYRNSSAPVTGEGRNLHIKGMGNGALIGGPNCDTGLLNPRNSSTVGSTASRSLKLTVEDLWLDGRYMPPSSFNEEGLPLTANDLCYATGFAEQNYIGCRFYLGAHYSLSPGGDSCLFPSGNRVTVARCRFWGAPDLAIYGSANVDGSLDNRSALLIGNEYYGCRNAWSFKREFEYIRSVGEYFNQCFNGPATTPASEIGEGRKVSISAPQFENMEAKCIDLRGCEDANINGAVIGGTFGYRLDTTKVDLAAMISLGGCKAIRVDFVGRVEGATASDHYAVRLVSNGGRPTQDCVIRGTATGVYNGLDEGATCNNNDIKLKLVDVVSPGTTSGAFTRYEYDIAGEATVLMGGVDASPVRTLFGSVRTASTVLTSVPLGRIIRVQPSSANIDITLPDGKPGDRMAAIKWTGSSDKFVNVKLPSGVTIERLRDINDIAWFVCENVGSWTVAERYLSSFDRRVTDSTAITASATLSGTLAGRIIDVQPPSGSTIDATLWTGGRSGEIAIVRKAAGSSTGAVAVKNVASTTLILLREIGDLATFVCDGANGWTILQQQTAALSLVTSGRINLRAVAAASVATPPTGVVTLFWDSADSSLKTKDSAGAVAAV